jgi:hypothetical protein
MLPRRNVSGKAIGVFKNPFQTDDLQACWGKQNDVEIPWKNPLQKMTSTIDLL